MKRCALPLVALFAASSLLFGQPEKKSSPSKEKPAADAITMTVITRTGKRTKHARADKIKIFVVINGDTRHKTHLDNPRRDDFELGATDTFKNIPVKLPLEEIETIRLAVEGDDMWHCESITFQFFQKELQSRPYKFNPNRYLSGAKEKKGFNATRLLDFKLKPTPQLALPESTAEAESTDEPQKKGATKTKK